MSIKRVTVFGAGAAGANVLMNLVHTHPALAYALVDFDTVEQRNFLAGTQPYGKGDVNRPKVQAMMRIVSAATGRGIEPVPKRITTLAEIVAVGGSPEESLLVEAFDNVPSKNLFSKLGKEWNVLHVGFSAQLTGVATWAESWTDLQEEASDAKIDVCQMHLARTFIMTLTGLASAVAAKFLDDGEKANVYFDRRLRLRTFPI